MNFVYIPLNFNVGNAMFAYMMGALVHKKTGARLHLRGNNGLSAFGLDGVSNIEHGLRRLR